MKWFKKTQATVEATVQETGRTVSVAAVVAAAAILLLVAVVLAVAVGKA